jgi:hypothetical protein
LDSETKECLFTEFVWPVLAKSVSCPSFKHTHKNQQEELKFTFDVSNCAHIFDEMLKNGYIN